MQQFQNAQSLKLRAPEKLNKMTQTNSICWCRKRVGSSKYSNSNTKATDLFCYQSLIRMIIQFLAMHVQIFHKRPITEPRSPYCLFWSGRPTSSTLHPNSSLAPMLRSSTRYPIARRRARGSAPKARLRARELGAGGKPSTRLPPGDLVELDKF